jgi:hypothetical protein
MPADRWATGRCYGDAICTQRCIRGDCEGRRDGRAIHHHDITYRDIDSADRYRRSDRKVRSGSVPLTVVP